MSDNETHWSQAAPTKSDVAFIAADTVLALKSVQLALMALRNGKLDTFDEQIVQIEQMSERIWAKFQKLTGEEG